MLSPGEVEQLRKVAVFGALPDEAFTQLVAVARRVDFTGPATVFNEGEPAREMFVVLSGELEVRKRGKDGGDARIAVLRPGDVAGEMAIIDIQPRSAAVRCVGPASLVVLSQVELARLNKEHPESYTIFIMNIAREISRRLRRVDGLLANIMVEVQGVWTGS